jgi:hypothetical protein
MLEFMIVFNDETNIASIKEFIVNYWPGTRLEESKYSTKKKKSWQYELYRAEKKLADAYIFDKGGDDWCYQYPRSLKGHPGLWFSMNERYYSFSEDDFNHGGEWLFKLIEKPDRKQILYFRRCGYVEYYCSMNELIKAIYSMKREFPTLMDYMECVFEWDLNPSDIVFDPEEIARLEADVRKFLKTDSALDYLFIKQIDGAFIFIPRPIAYIKKITDIESSGTLEVDMMYAFLEYLSNK